MKKTLLLIWGALLTLNIYALDPVRPDTFFSQDELNRTFNGEIIPRMYMKYNSRGENSHENFEIKRTRFNDEDYVPYEIKADEKGFIPFVLTEDNKLSFYNLLISFSKLEGMEYYSRRAGKIEKLVEECYRVESKADKKYKDKSYNTISPRITTMFKQKDNKFGELFYRSELYNEGNNFVLVNTCIDPLSKFIFNLNNSEEYKQIAFYMYDEEKQGFYYYTALVCRFRIDALLKTKKVGPTSYSNRLRAASVHLAKLLGVDWRNKLNAWPGKYDTY